MEKHLPRRNSIFQLYFKEYYDSLYRGWFPLSVMCYPCCCWGEVRMLCWMNWWNDYSVLFLDGDVYGCPLDWMSEKGNVMRWRNNRDLQLLSLICSFQERVACFVELNVLYCLCYYDSHGIRGDWLRVFCRHFFITVRDSCLWAVHTACRLACYAHCCRFIQFSWVHAPFVLLHPCDIPCVMRECNAVHSWKPEEGCILLWLLWYPCNGPLLCTAVVSIFHRCRDCASLHLQLNVLLFMWYTREGHPASEAILVVLCGRCVSFYPVSIS